MVIPAAYFASGQNKDGLEGTAFSKVWSVLNNTNDHGLSTIEGRYKDGLLIISRGTAILLLFVYVSYLIFQVCSAYCADR